MSALPPPKKRNGLVRKPSRSSSSSSRASSRRSHYKKLLWFKQPFPDNYTDPQTFLSHLQRNPRLQPYEFWSLMFDATIIVQHLASVVIFCCCFVEIFMERVSPVNVVGWASAGTVAGWGVWEFWDGRRGKEEEEEEEKEVSTAASTASSSSSSSSSSSPLQGNAGTSSSPPLLLSKSTRFQQRLVTVKSAVLIYAALLGLSPILKSLTRSTTSDSIWALSTWLLMINVAFFDYGSSSTARLPASISTNSAMMASAVLASRLPSTTHVFSLTLFSIEVFGLFPMFRRQLRAHSWWGHVILSIALIMAAWGSLFVTLTAGSYGSLVAGMVIGCAATFIAMGICSWWLISLQKYKNEIYGPWDPARPVIREHWDS